MAGLLSKKKARKILRHGEVRGRKLTHPQMRFFGWKAGGSKPRFQKKSRRR